MKGQSLKRKRRAPQKARTGRRTKLKGRVENLQRQETEELLREAREGRKNTPGKMEERDWKSKGRRRGSLFEPGLWRKGPNKKGKAQRSWSQEKTSNGRSSGWSCQLAGQQLETLNKGKRRRNLQITKANRRG